MTTPAELAATTAAAASAFAITRAASRAVRSGWLMAVADALDAASVELIPLADEESHLGTARLTGELARTTAQLRLFARVLDEGSYLEATIDHVDPSGTPPIPDLRRMLVPLGPVAVFSASNFPFAFSVAGGDTASALAAGCPVVVKGHPAHPRLSARTAELVAGALAAAGAPEGVFGHVTGVETGADLVRDPAIAAVGFTGSLHGGRALFDLAVSRPDPIPFYGELSAVNPVLITAAAVAARSEELATGLAGSFTLGVGQFCTKPGVVLVPRGSGFGDEVVAAVGTAAPVPMLTPAIAGGFHSGLVALAAHPDVTVLSGAPDQDADATHSEATGAAVVLAVPADAVLADPDALLVECFGPTTVLVEYDELGQALDVIRAVGGSLTATLHAEPDDEVADVVVELTAIAGRVLFGGWPTGVAVSWGQTHGGPWPSTTSLFTSVGSTSIRRFLRPVSYQGAPDALLPPELQEANPLGVPRRVDWVLQLG